MRGRLRLRLRLRLRQPLQFLTLEPHGSALGSLITKRVSEFANDLDRETASVLAGHDTHRSGQYIGVPRVPDANNN